MAFTVTLRPSGHQFTVEAEEAVLEAALRQRVGLPYGCRDGACGSCKTQVLTGEIDYPNGLPPGIGSEESARGMALLCQARARSDLSLDTQEVSELGQIQIKIMPVRVAATTLLAPDVMRVRLTLPSTQRLQFLAGQYVDILLSDGRRRAFSIANAPHDDEFLELHIRHVEHGDFTHYVFERMKPKSLLRIRGPLGSFFLREDSDRPMVLMAGGTGFAPIKGIIEHALGQGTRRPMHLYWGARARSDLYLHDLAQSWAQQYPNLSYTPVLSEPLPGDDWQGRVGLVHEAVGADFPDLSGYDIYTGGPPVMVQAGHRLFTAQGLPEAHFYSDAFEFANDKAVKKPAS